MQWDKSGQRCDDTWCYLELRHTRPRVRTLVYERDAASLKHTLFGYIRVKRNTFSKMEGDFSRFQLVFWIAFICISLHQGVQGKYSQSGLNRFPQCLV